MAQMLPLLNEAELKSLPLSEAKLYRALESQLPNTDTVLYSIAFISEGERGGRSYDGETDFIILRPGAGILFLEVKGGGIQRDSNTGKWASIDRNGASHPIKDPFEQVKNQKYQNLRYLNNSPAWEKYYRGQVQSGHAVFFPDLDNINDFSLPNANKAIIGCGRELRQLSQWIASVLKFWTGENSRGIPLNNDTISIAKKALHGAVSVRPLIGSQLQAEEAVRITLTAEQGRVFRAISSRPRAVISGGAGTGKTVLALERARELAASGKSVLLLCYHESLNTYLKYSCKDLSNVLVFTFHELCGWYGKQAANTLGYPIADLVKSKLNQNGIKDPFGSILPMTLVIAAKVHTLRFDAIIIDEAQDFEDNYWEGVQLLLKDPVVSNFYIFIDSNQTLLTSKTAKIPITDPPFPLAFNCRNTQLIHDFAYHYYKGEPVDPRSENMGAPISTICADNHADAAQQMLNEIERLISKERVLPTSIVVLVCGEPKSNYYDVIKNLGKSSVVNWVIEGETVKNGVRLDTVRRFKGLEADYVFLWGLGSMPFNERKQLLYVGATRAKSRLVLVGTRSAVDLELQSRSKN